MFLTHVLATRSNVLSSTPLLTKLSLNQDQASHGVNPNMTCTCWRSSDAPLLAPATTTPSSLGPHAGMKAGDSTCLAAAINSWRGASRRHDTVLGWAALGSSGTGHPAAMAKRRVTLRGAATLDQGQPDHPDTVTTRWNNPV